MVTDDAVGFVVFDHVIRHVGFGTIDESGDDIAIAIQFGDWVQVVLVQEALH